RVAVARLHALLHRPSQHGGAHALGDLRCGGRRYGMAVRAVELRHLRHSARPLPRGLRRALAAADPAGLDLPCLGRESVRSGGFACTPGGVHAAHHATPRRTTNTGHGACRMSFSAVPPMMRSASSERPCVAVTSTSTLRSSANLMIISAGAPMSTTS